MMRRCGLLLRPLSEQSVKAGSAPIEFPDFTRGAWNKRVPLGDRDSRLVCDRITEFAAEKRDRHHEFI